MLECKVLDDLDQEINLGDGRIAEGTFEQCRQAIKYYFDCYGTQYSETYSILDTRTDTIIETWHLCQEHSFIHDGICEFCSDVDL